MTNVALTYYLHKILLLFKTVVSNCT